MIITAWYNKTTPSDCLDTKLFKNKEINILKILRFCPLQCSSWGHKEKSRRTRYLLTTLQCVVFHWAEDNSWVLELHVDLCWAFGNTCVTKPDTWEGAIFLDPSPIIGNPLTNSVIDWVPISKLDWFDPSMWRCVLKICWGVTVANVDDEGHVGKSLLQLWKLRFGHKAKLLFRLRAQGLVKILKLKLRQDF